MILFLGALLPQFVDTRADPSGQLTVLAVLFVVVLAAVDIATTSLSPGHVQLFGPAHLRLLDGAAGVLLLLGGLALAMMRRP